MEYIYFLKEEFYGTRDRTKYKVMSDILFCRAYSLYVRLNWFTVCFSFAYTCDVERFFNGLNFN